MKRATKKRAWIKTLVGDMLHDGVLTDLLSVDERAELRQAGLGATADLKRWAAAFAQDSSRREAAHALLMLFAVEGRADGVAALARPEIVATPVPGVKGTALIMAVGGREGEEACVDLLLPVCDPRAKTNGGADALMVAARWGAMDSVQRLLPLCDPKACDSGGQSALMHACMTDKEEAALLRAKLLAPLSIVSQESSKGWSALSLAVSRGRKDVAQALMDAGPSASCVARSIAKVEKESPGSASLRPLLDMLREGLARREGEEIAEQAEAGRMAALAASASGIDAGVDPRPARRGRAL
jgi:hypothetical protein